MRIDLGPLRRCETKRTLLKFFPLGFGWPANWLFCRFHADIIGDLKNICNKGLRGLKCAHFCDSISFSTTEGANHEKQSKSNQTPIHPARNRALLGLCAGAAGAAYGLLNHRRQAGL